MRLRLVYLSLTVVLLSGSTFVGQTISQAEAAERIEKAMPEPLPQAPAINRPISDAEDDLLRGKVKSVSIFAVEADPLPLRKNSEGHYNKAGDLTKRVLYDHLGNPWRVELFGFLKGKRVMKAGYISYSYTPPAPPAPLQSGPQLPVDKRYDYSYEYKYDDKSRLVEESLYSNAGRLLSRKVITYEAHKATFTTYGSNEQITSRSIEEYDKKGNVIEVTHHALNGYGETKFSYEYEKFDSKGNWLSRRAKGKFGTWQNRQRDYNVVEVREITYH